MHEFFATIDSRLDFEPARTVGSYLWYRPYVGISPETCHVLDDGSGRVVGYCVGTADTVAFAQRWRDTWIHEIDDTILFPRPGGQIVDPAGQNDVVERLRDSVYNARCSMLQDWPKVLQDFPAHLHIDIIPEYQRRGFGRLLIRAFFNSAKEGAYGVHIDMLKTNANALAFYHRLAFFICSQVLDSGASGERGVNGAVLTMVREF